MELLLNDFLLPNRHPWGVAMTMKVLRTVQNFSSDVLNVIGKGRGSVVGNDEEVSDVKEKVGIDDSN